MYAPLHSADQAHITRRRAGLAQVLHVDELRGVPIPGPLAGCGALFADGGQSARDDPEAPGQYSWSAMELSSDAVALDRDLGSSVTCDMYHLLKLHRKR